MAKACLAVDYTFGEFKALSTDSQYDLDVVQCSCVSSSVTQVAVDWEQNRLVSCSADCRDPQRYRLSFGGVLVTWFVQG